MTYVSCSQAPYFYRNINLSPTEGFTFVLFFVLYIPKCKIFFTYTSSQIPNNSILYESVFSKLIFQTQVVLHPNLQCVTIIYKMKRINYLLFIFLCINNLLHKKLSFSYKTASWSGKCCHSMFLKWKTGISKHSQKGTVKG